MASTTLYEKGYDSGRAAGAHDIEQGTSVHHDRLADARDAASGVVSRDGRAFFLGWLRGYRESVRTFKWGRWGT